MKHQFLRKALWRLSQLFAGGCLFLPPLLALASLIFPTYVCNPYTAVNCWKIGTEMNTALANTARILGTGAALTLLATAADREIEKVTARDVLKEQYRGLLISYGVFFALVFFASFFGDCNCSIVAVLSTVGALILSIWFFGLSLILLLDTERQRNMVFGYYLDGVVDPSTSQNKRVFLLQKSVALTASAPFCWDQLRCVFQAAIRLFSTGDESSKKAAMDDRWAEVNMLEGVEMMNVAWSALWQAGNSKDGFSKLQMDIVCRNILTTRSWMKESSDRAILLSGLVSFWLPWEKGRTYTEAYANLESFCAAQRAENKGDPWSEQIISELACAFGVGMAISLANQDKPSWVDKKDLETAWKRFASEFQSSVFSAIDNPAENKQAELENLLEYVEWISRKWLRISWAQYQSDRKDLITSGDPNAAAAITRKITNTFLLGFTTSKYINRRR